MGLLRSCLWLARAIVGDEAPEHICRHRPMPAKAKVPSKFCPNLEWEGNPRLRWCAAPPALESSPAPRKGAAARLAVLLLEMQKASQRHLAIVGGMPQPVPGIHELHHGLVHLGSLYELCGRLVCEIQEALGRLLVGRLCPRLHRSPLEQSQNAEGRLGGRRGHKLQSTLGLRIESPLQCRRRLLRRGRPVALHFRSCRVVRRRLQEAASHHPMIPCLRPEPSLCSIWFVQAAAARR